MIASNQLRQAADDFVREAGSDPALATIARQVEAIMRKMDSPGQRAIRSVSITIDYGAGDGEIIDAQPNHAGQIPSAQDPDA